MPSNEIRVMYQPVSVFSYDESRVRFRVVYDAKSHEVRITSGRHGYSMLAQACTFEAVTTEPMERSFWDADAASSVDELITVMNPGI